MAGELFSNLVRIIENSQLWGEPTCIAGIEWEPHITPMEVFQATTHETMMSFLHERGIDLRDLLPGYSGDVRAALAEVCAA